MSPTIGGIAAPPRFATHELAYLLAGREDDSAGRSRELLGIPRITSQDDLFRAGLSSLVARGLISEDQGSVLPRNEAGLVGFSLGTATRWVSVLVRTESVVDLVVFVQGRDVALMVRRAPADTLDFVPLRPNAVLTDVVSESVQGLLDSHSRLAMIIRSANTVDETGLFIRHEDATGWQIGHDPVFPGDAEWPAPDLVVHSVDRAGVDEAVSAILSPEGRS